MRNLYFIFSLISLVLLFNCSKDDSSNNEDNTDVYKENKELVLPESSTYFIADVYMDGVHKKINMQTETSNCFSAWGKRFCNIGQSHKEFYGILKDKFSNENYKIWVGFRGECSSCSFSSLVNKDLNNFTYLNQDLEGLFITFSTFPNLIDSSVSIPLFMNYSTGYTPLSLQDNSEFKLIDVLEEGTNGENKYIVANFKCTLVNDQIYNNPNQPKGGVIEIKNAVIKARIGD